MKRDARKNLNLAMLRLADGDRQAMREVHDALRPPLHAYCHARGINEGAIDDVVQRVMMKVFQQSMHFRNDGDALAWALSLTHWECRTERKKVARSNERAEPLLPADFGPDLVEIRDSLRQAFATLTNTEQETLAKVIVGDSLTATGRKRKERLFDRLRKWFIDNG